MFYSFVIVFRLKPTTDTHAQISGELLGQSRDWIRDNNLALDGGTNATYIVSNTSVLEPDGNITPSNRNRPPPGMWVEHSLSSSLQHNTTQHNKQHTTHNKF
jgi:Uma2 family endonuclease